MAINERPGVYSTVEVTGSVLGSGRGKVVGLAAVSKTGVKGECTRILSYAEAIAQFGADCAMTELIRVLFVNGAFAVDAVPAAVNGAASTADYAAAFGVLMASNDVAVMVCDSTAAAVHGALKDAISGASEGNKYRIGIVEGSGTVSEVSNAAKAINFERISMVYPAGGGSGSVCETAAAVAGVVAAGIDPALPLNGAELFGAPTAQRSFSDAEVTALVTAGVTPVERVGSGVFVVRGITTRTLTGGVADSTFREMTTVLIIDDVVPAVRTALRAKFPRVKNTAQTRGAIRTQVIIELESKLRQEIIDGYGAVSAEASAEDPTVCVVSFEFAVAHGLNRINLTAHISV